MRTVAIAGVLVVGGLVAVGILAGGVLPDGAKPSPAPPDRTTTAAPGAYPPGLTASGVENASRLLATHRETLLSAGYEVRTERTLRTGGSATNFTTARAVAATAGQSTIALRRTRRDEFGEWSVYELWANDSTPLARFDAAGVAPTVRPARVDRSTDHYAGIARLGPYLRNGEFELVAVTREGDRQLYTYRATGYDLPDRRPGEVTAFTGQLVVTGQGRVRTLQVSLVRTTSTADGRKRVLETFAYRLVRVGVGELAPPQWATGNETGRSTDDPSAIRPGIDRLDTAGSTDRPTARRPSRNRPTPGGATPRP